MSKREKGLWILYAAILILLFLMSSTNLIIKEKKVEIHPISVVVEDTKDEYYQNLKKGMDQAAREYQADASFITLYESNDQIQQVDMIRREIDDGARAVILAPVSEEKLKNILMGKPVNSPLVIMNGQISNDWVAANITIDYEEAGRKLGEAVATEYSSDIPVSLFTEGLMYGNSLKVYDGVTAVLEERGFQVALYTRNMQDTFLNVIEATAYPGSGESVIVALDTKSLAQAADIIGQSSVYGNYITGLYGIGSTVSILNALDKGVIRGIVVYNQFDMGYVSVQKAVRSIKSGGQTEQIILDFFYIEKKDLRDKKYEKMLYPIE